MCMPGKRHVFNDSLHNIAGETELTVSTRDQELNLAICRQALVRLRCSYHQNHSPGASHPWWIINSLYVYFCPVTSLGRHVDVLDELETVYDNLSKNAKDYIHSEYSPIVGVVASRIDFCADLRAERYSGRGITQPLSSSGISTVLVPDSSVYGLTSRIIKVVLGSPLAATATRAHSPPVVVCSWQFKLTPQWNLYHEYGALDFADPSGVLGFEDSRKQTLSIKLEMIDAYITNEWVIFGLFGGGTANSSCDGDHPPSSVYHLIKELYDDEDFEL
ncbi:hypothetical protein EDD15DRAFT_2197935 [Pisolithus albus]|nr:hypothetical protein EDD15DRAFT_2197935 [Pisolithus albus]